MRAWAAQRTRNEWFSCAIALLALSAVFRPAEGASNQSSSSQPTVDANSPTSVATLPSYAPGDSFTYSDGRTETVTGVHGEIVDWRNDQGFAFSTYRNFLLPRSRWQADGRRGETSLEAAPDLLWPLVVGDRAEYVAHRTVILEGQGARRDFVQNWSCRVEARAVLAVAAGLFDTYRLACERRDEVAALRETRTWSYAPAIGHYVLAIEVRDGVEKTRELVAYHRTPGGGTAAQVDPAESAFQQALEKLVSGLELSWHSDDGRRSISVTPIKTFQRNGLYCRNYRQVTATDGRNASWTGTACRAPDGIWQRQAIDLK